MFVSFCHPWYNLVPNPPRADFKFQSIRDNWLSLLDGGSIPGTGRDFSLLHFDESDTGVHPAYSMGSESSFLGLRRPRCQADHSLQSSAEVKNMWCYTPIPPYVFMSWWLIKHRDKLIIFLPIRIYRRQHQPHTPRVILVVSKLVEVSFVLFSIT
jgi:hypothetical protein